MLKTFKNVKIITDGKSEIRDIELELIEDAYIDSDLNSNTFYTAPAEDKDGNSYKIVWYLIAENCEDESNACDWDNPSCIYAL